MPPLENAISTAAFLVTVGMHLWVTWRQTQEGRGGGRGGTRRVVLITPQGERIVIEASDEALREMGLLPPAEGGGAGGGDEHAAAATRVAVRIHRGGGGDFGPDDYEALSALDDGLRPEAAAPVSQELLDVLPTHEHRCRRGAPSSSSSAAAAAAAPGAGSSGGENENGSRGGGEPETCSVCLQDFADADTVRTLPCLHYFHCECVDPWLMQRGRNLAACPVCKTRVFV